MGEGLFQMAAGELEFPEVHMNETAVEVTLGQRERMLATLAERHHVVRRLERGAILAAQEVEHPLPADHDDQAVVVTSSLIRGPGCGIGLIHARRRVAVGCLKGGGSIGEQVGALPGLVWAGG